MSKKPSLSASIKNNSESNNSESNNRESNNSESNNRESVSSPTRESPQTVIIENALDHYPFCALPKHFFDFALSRGSRGKETPLVAINAWNGMEILGSIKKQ